MPHGLLRDQVVTMHGRLAGGAPPPRVPGEWFCQVCQRGGSARSSCFRCGCPRKDSEAMSTPCCAAARASVPWASPGQTRNSGCPTERRPSPQGVRKQAAFGNDKGAVARMVLETLSCLNLDDGVMSKIRAQLEPPLPAPKPSKKLADLGGKIDKAQHDFTRLQNVVVKKQAELHQSEERANRKSKEPWELDAEMLEVKKQVIQVPPPAAPPTLSRFR